MWISPSGFALEDAGPEDYPLVDLESGEITRGKRRPASEALMHLFTYRARPEVMAIIHTQPRMTIAQTGAGRDLKPICADQYVHLDGNVSHVDYVTVTTPELARVVEQTFQSDDCVGVILRNHGAITVGRSVREALFRTLAIEEQALIQWHALTAGQPTYLTEDQRRELDKLGTETYRRTLRAEMGNRE